VCEREREREMGICCSSTSPELPEQTHMGQSESFKKIIMSSVQTEKSIPPALDLRKRRESNFIDGLLYSELFRAGFVALHRGKDVCNKINVFPIPDGDTGSNMVLTMRDAVKHLDSKETDLVASSRAVALRTTLVRLSLSLLLTISRTHLRIYIYIYTTYHAESARKLGYNTLLHLLEHRKGCGEKRKGKTLRRGVCALLGRCRDEISCGKTNRGNDFKCYEGSL